MRTDSERLAVIEITVLDLKKQLLGNGQPGQIQILQGRVEALENWKWWVVGAGFGAGGVVGWLARLL